ncbi:MAG: hypothetical protein D6714_21465 [Bacteroidetes bacterium]|nr:MAG: hypothetical protein D6714_21465 [Bacteroidota bacterium]
MKKSLFFAAFLLFATHAKAWWDPGHLVTAMIAYKFLNPNAKKQVDRLTKVIERDYPYANHFIALATWPDDLKAEGVTSFNTWHYTDMPYNPNGVALPPRQEVDILWAIRQAESVLSAPHARDIERARHLAFLAHFVGDIHQPLHSTSYYSNDLPGGNAGGNAFPVSAFGKWRNLHQVWDDGCGFLSSYNDIRPYGKPKEPLTENQINRIEALADSLIREFPPEHIIGIRIPDEDFWALESHKLAIEYGYRGVQSVNENGWKKYIQPNDPPSGLYLANGQRIVKQRLVMAGYRLAMILNQQFPEE